MEIAGKEKHSRYEMIKVIDYGSFGGIHKVRSALDNTIYGLKQIRFRGNFRDDPFIISEMYCLTKLKHRNIIRLHEIIIDIQEIHIVMEYAENENLERYMCVNKNLEFHQKYKIYAQILEGVKFCHDMDVAHRDLTPANILLTEDLVIKIADFGLAVKCSVGNEKTLICKDYLGRPSYLPPEVLSKTPFLPKPADIWSLGVTLLFILFGSIPFSGFHKDVLEQQMTYSWDDFIHENTAEPNMKLKLSITETLQAQLQVDFKMRKDIHDLIKIWHNVSPATMLENVIR